MAATRNFGNFGKSRGTIHEGRSAWGLPELCLKVAFADLQSTETWLMNSIHLQFINLVDILYHSSLHVAVIGYRLFWA